MSAPDAHLSSDAKTTYNKYLKYKTGDAFLFGKGNFAENKFVWVATDKDNYSSAEIISEAGGKYTVRLPDASERTVVEGQGRVHQPSQVRRS